MLSFLNQDLFKIRLLTHIVLYDECLQPAKPILDFI